MTDQMVSNSVLVVRLALGTAKAKLSPNDSLVKLPPSGQEMALVRNIHPVEATGGNRDPLMHLEQHKEVTQQCDHDVTVSILKCSHFPVDFSADLAHGQGSEISGFLDADVEQRVWCRVLQPDEDLRCRADT